VTANSGTRRAGRWEAPGAAINRLKVTASSHHRAILVLKMRRAGNAAPVANSRIATAPAELARAPPIGRHRAARTVMLPLLVPIVRTPVPAPSVPLRLCVLSVRPVRSRSRT
jgi:hypothetical protein